MSKRLLRTAYNLFALNFIYIAGTSAVALAVNSKKGLDDSTSVAIPHPFSSHPTSLQSPLNHKGTNLIQASTSLSPQKGDEKTLSVSGKDTIIPHALSPKRRSRLKEIDEHFVPYFFETEISEVMSRKKIMPLPPQKRAHMGLFSDGTPSDKENTSGISVPSRGLARRILFDRFEESPPEKGGLFNRAEDYAENENMSFPLQHTPPEPLPPLYELPETEEYPILLMPYDEQAKGDVFLTEESDDFSFSHDEAYTSSTRMSFFEGSLAPSDIISLQEFQDEEMLCLQTPHLSPVQHATSTPMITSSPPASPLSKDRATPMSLTPPASEFPTPFSKRRDEVKRLQQEATPQRRLVREAEELGPALSMLYKAHFSPPPSPLSKEGRDEYRLIQKRSWHRTAREEDIDKALDLTAKHWTDQVKIHGLLILGNDALIDPNYIDPVSGLSNLELMLNGNTPIGPDGKHLNIHHFHQKNTIAGVVTSTFHGREYSLLHRRLDLTDPEEGLVGASRADRIGDFDSIREKYWKWKGQQFLKKQKLREGKYSPEQERMV